MKVDVLLTILFFLNGFVIGGLSQPSVTSQGAGTPGLSTGGGGGGTSHEVEAGDIVQPQGAEAKSQGLSTGVDATANQTLPASNAQLIQTGSGTFNVKDYGAKGDGQTDDCKAIESAWKAACASSGSPKVWIPKGTYLSGPVKFFGPCKSIKSITVQMEGTLKASTDLGAYQYDWINFGWVDGLTLTGGGTFDGQGASAWPMNKCPKSQNCKLLPANIKFNAMTNTKVNGITSLNSKFFHIGIINSQKFDMSGLTITAPETSPNTDGIHIERCKEVSVTHSDIGTGDDCISIGQGNSHLTIDNVKCGPGHGISVGSLGKYPNEEDVTGLVVKDCTITGTMFGVRIKTWENSPSASVASNMTFENVIMNNVANPIIIDQTYCPFASCDGSAPSRVKLQDIFFRKIKGTSSTPVAVTLECSKATPCQNVVLEDIHLEHSSGAVKSLCTNVKATFTGPQLPAACV